MYKNREKTYDAWHTRYANEKTTTTLGTPTSVDRDLQIKWNKVFSSSPAPPGRPPAKSSAGGRGGDTRGTITPTGRAPRIYYH